MAPTTEQSEGGSAQQKRHRAVRLSRVDAERLARGEISTPEEALHIYDAPPLKVTRSTADKKKQSRTLSAHEREILDNVPPHFGKI